jgi:hypothetical protein
MHVKVTMKAVPRSELSEHELKRCRALAHGNAWQVVEEDLLWWSLDRQSWQPVPDNLYPNTRRWLMVETEAGVEPLSLWEVRDRVPEAEPRRERAPEGRPVYSERVYHA